MTALSERRIGQRKLVSPVAIDWRVDVKGRKRKAAKRRQTGYVVDLSVSGASIEAPRADDLLKGHRVVIGLGEWRAVVIIRRIAEVSNERNLRYGVEFLDMDPEFVERIHHVLAADRSAVDAFWRSAT
jgi:hypothetical protein